MQNYLFISRFPPPFGGVSNQVKLLAELLNSKADINVKVIDLKKIRIYSHINGSWKSTYLLVNIRFLMCLILSSLKMVQNVSWLMNNHFFKLDKYIFWRFILVYFTYALSLYLKGDELKLIYSFHFGGPSLTGGILANDVNCQHITAVFGEFHTNRLKINRQIRLLEACSNIRVSCSKYCGETMKKVKSSLGYDLLYYGGDLVQLNNMYKKALKVGKNKGKTSILFLGRIEQEMGIMFFLDLIQDIERIYPNKYRYVICGQKGSLSDNVIAFKKAFDGDLTIKFSVTFEERNQILVESDVLIVPSINERACFGLAIVEGLAAGSVVLARDIGGHKEPLLNNNDYLFGDNTTSEELAVMISGCVDRLNCDDNQARFDMFREAVIARFELEACLRAQTNYIESKLKEFENEKSFS